MKIEFKKIPYSNLDEFERNSLWDDNLHYTPKGYDRIGEEIFNSFIENYSKMILKKIQITNSLISINISCGKPKCDNVPKIITFTFFFSFLKNLSFVK